MFRRASRASCNILGLPIPFSTENGIFAIQTNLQMTTKILIIGACGQIGTELTAKLRAVYGNDNVIASDIRKLNNDIVNNGIFEVVNALDYNQIEHLVEQYQITDVYLMAALLSATVPRKRWSGLMQHATSHR